jgi:hypothetical protein
LFQPSVSTDLSNFLRQLRESRHGRREVRRIFSKPEFSINVHYKAISGAVAMCQFTPTTDIFKDYSPALCAARVLSQTSVFSTSLEIFKWKQTGLDRPRPPEVRSGLIEMS